MGKNLIKTKAVFEIFVIICAIFTVYLINSSEEVSAEEKVCCEKTLDSSEFMGESCIYTELNNCDTSNGLQGSGIACEQTTYCQPTCCIKDGECVQNTLRSQCIAEGGTPREGADCNIKQCQQGCCMLPDQTLFTTQVACGNLIEDFQNLNINEVFDASITTEEQCLLASRSSEEGCCVTQDSCSFGTRAQCNQQSGEFNLDTLCSYPSLGCEVTAQHSLGCLPDRNEVYWFDSAGNPENIYGTNYRADGLMVPKELSCDPNENNAGDVKCGNCNYVLGSICSEASDAFLNNVRSSNLPENIKPKVDYMCKDLNCYDLYIDDVNGQRWQQELNGRNYRVNGESWCQYEGATGYGKDLIGSRQYKRICVNGQEIVEPCDEARNQICNQNVIPQSVSGVAGGMMSAQCRTNLIAGCFEANNEDENCELTQEQINQCGDDINCKKAYCREKACTTGLSDCYWNQDFKVCAPMVPPGTLNSLGDENKEAFRLDCTEFWVKENTFSRWDCEGNCECHTRGYADNMQRLCQSLGDYGASFNVAGRYSSGGFLHLGNRVVRGGTLTGRYHIGNDAEGITPLKFADFNKAENAIDGSVFWVLATGSLMVNRILSEGKSFNFDPNTDFLNSLLVLSGVAAISAAITVALSSYVTSSLFTLGIGSGTIVGGELAISNFIGPIASTFLGLSGEALATLATVAWIIALGALVAYFITIVGAGDAEITYTFVCDSWVPPTGGQDCEKCSEFEKCDEYKCSSLGAACEFKNENGEQACVWENRGDTTPPIIDLMPITPLKEDDFIPVGGNLNTGYQFKNIILSYTPLEIGIETNERSQCKISKLSGKTYDEMTNYLGNAGYFFDHKMLIPISNEEEIEGDEVVINKAGQSYLFYVKCQDVNGNKNIHDYFVKFDVSNAPDKQAPIIEDFSIKNQAYIPYGKASTELIVYLNEAASRNGGCKYSTEDKNYEQMENSLICLQNSVDRNRYSCSTKPDEKLQLRQNQDNTFYFRCKDNFGNTNTQSQPAGGYTLKSSKQLQITSSEPEGRVETVDVELKLATSNGAENGKAKCYYSLTKFFDPNGLLFKNTDSIEHLATLTLQPEKSYNFYAWCRDIAGNEDTKNVEFFLTTPDLNITKVEPLNNSKIYNIPFELKVTTIKGYNNNGDSICSYRYRLLPNGAYADGGMLINEGAQETETLHKRGINLGDGKYLFDIICRDSVGKSDKTYWNLEIRRQASPQLRRVYKEGTLLTIEISEPSECKYSGENFNYESEGALMTSSDDKLKHQALLQDVFYIKCKNVNNNNINQEPFVVYT